ncbi:hypothetical protein [Candidatus Poriferisodalis sp.]|uniref:hypothetical protein n=1 Tax=Candidatus Poriferisodalis sp. TaxID=3101277 RepID=UPI003B01E6A6
MATGANEIGSEAWCAAMSEVLAGVELPEVQATVEQRIGDGNGGPMVAYRLVIEGRRVHLEPVPVPDGDSVGSPDGPEGTEEAGTAEGADDRIVVMSQSRETAEAVRRGELGALAALQAGLIKVSGDVRVLIAAADALALVDAALGAALAGEQDGADSRPIDGSDDPGNPNDGADDEDI